MYLVEAIEFASPSQLVAHERRKKMRGLFARLEKPMPVIREIVQAPVIVANIVPEIESAKAEKPKTELPSFIWGNATSIVRVITKACANQFNVNPVDIVSPERTAQIVKARHVAFYLCQSLVGWSQPEIGRRFRRDHTTVLHGLRKVRAKRDSDPEYAEMLQKLRANVSDHLHPEATVPAVNQCDVPEQQGAGPGANTIA